MGHDAELLRHYARDRSEAAFAELVRLHVNLVYFAALRQVGGDPHEAQDVTQTVFTDLARKASSLTGHPALASWLHKSTRFAALKARRTESRRRQHEQEAEIMQTLLHDSNSAAEWERLRPMIDDVIHQLNDRDREVVLQRFFEGRAFAEIGAALNVSEDGARMRVERALDKLRVALARRGVDSTTAALAVAFANQAGATAPAGLITAVTNGALEGAARAAEVTVTAAGILKIMSTTKVITGVVALVALGLALYQTKVAREAEAAVAALNQERDHLTQRAQTSEEAFKKSQREIADLNASRDALLAAQKSAATERAASPQPASRGPVIPVTLNMGLPNLDYAKPETRALVLEDTSMKFRARFDRLFRAINLTPEQQERFIGILAERTQGFMDLAVALQGIPQKSPNYEEKTREVARQVMTDSEGKLRELLGDAAYQQYRQVNATLPQRPVVEQLASRLYDSPTPLTAEQADQLLTIFNRNGFGDPRAGASPATSLDGTPLPANAINFSKALAGQQNVEWARFITDAAVAHAESVLAPPQLAALKQLQKQQLIQTKLAPTLLSPPTQ